MVDLKSKVPDLRPGEIRLNLTVGACPLCYSDQPYTFYILYYVVRMANVSWPIRETLGVIDWQQFCDTPPLEISNLSSACIVLYFGSPSILPQIYILIIFKFMVLI